MSIRRAALVCVVMLLIAGSSACAQDTFKPAAHPFILWNADDIKALRHRIETEPWAKQAYAELVASREPYGDEMRDLFRYAVMGDAEAGARQKKALLSLLKQPHPLGRAMEFRVLAYDVLYDELSADERAAVEKMFRRYIEYSIVPGATINSPLFNDEKNYSRYDGEGKRYTRTNWLPNIIFPRKLSANLMAVALRDEELIRDCWAQHGSIQWYMDEYLGDWGFYFEEMSKMSATPGALLLYANGLERLGLNGLGFGYKGRQGATLRGHIHTVIDQTYPMLDLGSDRPMFPRMSPGDVRGAGPWQQFVVAGYYPDGDSPGRAEGTEMWRAPGAWGGTMRGNSPQWDRDKTEKMLPRLWFEFAQARWPEDGYAWFLAQMRPPDAKVYTPQLFFGIEPIDPAKAAPPPAPSWIAPQRGLVMLRAVESPDYWTSPAPAVGFRLPNEYAHHVNDQLAITEMMAFNRMLYINPHVDPGYAFKFSRSARSHHGVMVDGHIAVEGAWDRTGTREPKFTQDYTTRHDFTDPVKFVSCFTSGRYQGVAESRSLFLTRQYLLEISDLRSDAEHSFMWKAHALGRPVEGGGAKWAGGQIERNLFRELDQVHTAAPTGDGWVLSIAQDRPDDLAPDAPFDETWWQRRVGVRVELIASEGMKAYWAPSPRNRYFDREERREKPAPVLTDSTTIVATQWGKAARFVVVHTPFERKPLTEGASAVLASTDNAIAVRVVDDGQKWVDVLLLRLADGNGKSYAKPVTLTGPMGLSFTFADHAYLRIDRDADTVAAVGDLRAMVLNTTAKSMTLNGRPVKVTTQQVGTGHSVMRFGEAVRD